MTLRAHLIDAAVEANPGETTQVAIEVHNPTDHPQTVRITAVGLAAAADSGESIGAPTTTALIEPHATDTVVVPISVPDTFGPGRHSIGLRVEGVVPTDAVLVTATVVLVSVANVDIEPRPSPIRGRRRVKAQIDLTNREPYAVSLEFGVAEQTGGRVRARFKPPTVTLPPDGQMVADVKLRGPSHWVGERLQHNVRLVARSRGSQTGVNLPYVQKPVLATRLRSVLLGLGVIILWVALVVGVVLFIDRNHVNLIGDDTLSSADGTDISVPGDGTGGDGTGGSGTAGDGTGSDGTAGDGTGSDGTGGSGTGSDGTGSDGTGSDGTGSDGTGSDGTGSDGTGGDGTGDATVIDDGIPDVPAGATKVSIGGTIEVSGSDSTDGVEIIPRTLQLAEISESDQSVITPDGIMAPAPRKIWSARYAPAAEPTRVFRTAPIRAIPFAPETRRAWELELNANQAYEIAFVRPGYQTQAFVITPKAGEPIEFDVLLEPADGILGGEVRAGGLRENVAITVTDGFVDYQTATDENGYWEIQGVPTDELYTILANVDGYGAAARQDRLEPEENEQTDLDLTLVAGQGVIVGDVVDLVKEAEDGLDAAGLPGVTVTASDGDVELQTTTLTDDPGRYVIPNVQLNRRWTIRATRDGYSDASTEVNASSPTTTSPILRMLPLEATISGIITNEKGEAVTRATVKVLSDAIPEPVALVQSGSTQGDFTLGRIPTGRYQVVIEHWRHAPIRLDLVVTDAQNFELFVPGSDEPQTERPFSITMQTVAPTPLTLPTGSLSLEIREADESAPCKPDLDGNRRDQSLCPAVFGATVHIRTTDPALIPDDGQDSLLFKKVAGTDKDGNAIDLWEFKCPAPGGTCNSGSDYPDYTISGIPVGTYTVLVSHVDYNSRSDTVTIFPNTIQKETFPMVRFGTVRGRVVDSITDQPLTNVFVQINKIAGDGSVESTFDTPFIGQDGYFQTADNARLPVGQYRVSVDVNPGQHTGYHVNPANNDIDADLDNNNPNLGGLDFEIQGFVPGQVLTSSLIQLGDIQADPYPQVQVRVYEPTTSNPQGPFAPILETPTARITCSNAAGQVDLTGAPNLADHVITAAKTATYQLDDIGTAADGQLTSCELRVDAPDHHGMTYRFFGDNPFDLARSPLVMGEDRYLDIALTRCQDDDCATNPSPIQPSGSLWWVDYGKSDTDRTAVPGATITTSSVVARLVASDQSQPAGTIASPDVGAIRPFIPTGLTAQTDTNGEWFFADIVAGSDTITPHHLLGSAEFDIVGPPADGSLGPDQFADGEITLSIDETGTPVVTVQTNPEQQPNPEDPDDGFTNGYDAELNPKAGRIVGQVEIWSVDTNKQYTLFNGTATLGTHTTTNFTADGSGAFLIDGQLPGTWDLVLNPVTGHVLHTGPIVNPPHTGITDETGADRVDDYYVEPGQAGPTAVFRAVELGSATVEIESKVTGDPTVSTTPVTVSLGGQSDTAVPFRVENLPVPHVDPSVNTTDHTDHTLVIGNAGVLNPTTATIEVRTRSNNGDVSTGFDTFEPVNLRTGWAHPDGWQPGTDYEFTVKMDPYGRRFGTIDAYESDGTTPTEVCATGADPIRLTAVPIYYEPLPIFPVPTVTDDPRNWRGPFEDTQRWRLPADSCGSLDPVVIGQPTTDFVLGGLQVNRGLQPTWAGDYALIATHDDFDSTHGTFVPGPSGPFDAATYPPANIEFTMPASDAIAYAATTLSPRELPLLTVKQTKLDVSVTSDSTDGVPYFVLTRSTGAQPDSTPTLVETGFEVAVDPGDGYTIEVRACDALTFDPETVDFNTCEERFPAIMSFSVPRSSTTVGVDLPLLGIGSTIEMTLTFENSVGGPACPKVLNSTVSRRYDTFYDPDNTQPGYGTVAGSTIALEDGTIPASEIDEAASETESFSFIADATACGTSGGNTRTLTFSDMIPKGFHTFTLPDIDGFGTPRIVYDGDETGPPAAEVDHSIEFLVHQGRPPTSGPPSHTIDVTYTADDVDLKVYLCTTATPDPDCTTPYRDAVVNLVDENDVVVAQGTVTPDLVVGDPAGVEVSFTGVPPATGIGSTYDGYLLQVTDQTHDTSLKPEVLVWPNDQTVWEFDFPGSTAVIGIRLDHRDLDEVIPDLGNPDRTFSVVEKSSGTSVDSTPRRCDIQDGKKDKAHDCFDVAPLSDSGTTYTVTITVEGFITATQDITVTPGGEQGEKKKITKRGVLEVKAFAYDAAGNPLTVNWAEQASLIKLVAVSGSGQVTPLADRTGCGQITGCFRYYADPGSEYEFQIDSNDTFVSTGRDVTTKKFEPEDKSGKLDKQFFSSTPDANDQGLLLRPRVIDVKVDRNNLAVDEVQLTFASGTFIQTTKIDGTPDIYRFSTLDALPLVDPVPGDPVPDPAPIPMGETATAVYIDVADSAQGRDLEVSTGLDLDSTFVVYPWLEVTGQVNPDTPLPVDVEATSGDTTHTITLTDSSDPPGNPASEDYEFSFSGDKGLDVGLMGADRTWTIKVRDAPALLGVDIVVDSTTIGPTDITDDLESRVIDVDIETNALDVTAVKLTFSGGTVTQTAVHERADAGEATEIETFRFTTADGIDFTGNPTKVVVEVSDGRNREVLTPAVATRGTGIEDVLVSTGPEVRIEVLGYLTVSGTVAAGATETITVEATTPSDVIGKKTVDLDAGETAWSFDDIDNKTDGTSVTWTFTVKDAATGEPLPVGPTTVDDDDSPLTISIATELALA